MKRIGIMGGTFNPIHQAHLLIAEAAKEQFDLDQVLFMLSKNPPHKQSQDIVSDAHRKRMIQHAIYWEPYFKFSDLELKRDGVTYTKDTLAYLKKEKPGDMIFFIMGGDSLAALDTWCEPEYICQNCHILVACRGEEDHSRIAHWISYYGEKYGAEISEIKMPRLPVSSQLIREHIAEGGSAAWYCPLVVDWYIQFHSLYGFKREKMEKPMDDSEILRILSACLKPKRYQHTLGVAMTASSLASVHGADEAKAYTAGLLHDCAKYLTAREQIAACEEAGIPLSPVERENVVLIHGKLGAHMAKTMYGITDEEILSAIRYHTTGRPEMTLLEKIIYLADYMEPGRKMECRPYSMEKIRQACYADLDRALYMALACSIAHLKKTGRPIDTLTLETYDYYDKS